MAEANVHPLHRPVHLPQHSNPVSSAEGTKSDFLTKKIGPLPVWGWGGIAVAAYLVYRSGFVSSLLGGISGGSSGGTSAGSPGDSSGSSAGPTAPSAPEIVINMPGSTTGETTDPGAGVSQPDNSGSAGGGEAQPPPASATRVIGNPIPKAAQKIGVGVFGGPGTQAAQHLGTGKKLTASQLRRARGESAHKTVSHGRRQVQATPRAASQTGGTHKHSNPAAPSKPAAQPPRTGPHHATPPPAKHIAAPAPKATPKPTPQPPKPVAKNPAKPKPKKR